MQTFDYYTKLLEYNSLNKPLWQVTIVHTDGSSPAKAGMKMLISTDGLILGNLGGGEMEHSIIEYIGSHKPSTAEQMTFDLGQANLMYATSTAMICGGSVTVFIEPLFNSNNLYIIGAGHCGKALGHLARLCGFWVKLIDNREDILKSAPKDCFDEAEYSNYEDITSVIGFGSYTWVVIMTHGHVHDQEVLQQCIEKETLYLGMIGSKSKVKQTFDSLMDQGYTAEDITRIHAPIGLTIGSQSPYEIAVSIMAELISIKRNEHKTGL
ncbi:MAG: XdhC/CoxI family protein [Candidatus Cloacimonetes bacterium]|nr:XdhC/CoxI family protein [Candidatus Cloacimonadota bacterium]